LPVNTVLVKGKTSAATFSKQENVATLSLITAWSVVKPETNIAGRAAIAY
jgi:hypothetical protein